MRIGELTRSTKLALAVGLLFAAASISGPAFAQTPPAAAAPAEKAAPAPSGATPPGEAAPAPAPEPPAAKSPPALPDAEAPQAPPGVPSDATVETVDVPSRPVALLTGDAQWTDGFKSIVAAIDKVKAAMATAGLKQDGRPFSVFLSTDDTSFHFSAMVPIAEKPEGKTDLTDGVTIGDSPSGKAIKFLHRGAYDDIDSTYDLITAYLDEKGLEAKNLFMEEYLTDTRQSDDPTLQADIYVMLK